MGTYSWEVRVHSRYQLDDWMREYLGGLNIRNETDGTALLTGELPDMPAVYGLILWIRDAGISLHSLHVERRTQKKGENNV